MLVSGCKSSNNLAFRQIFSELLYD
jgi:hypothetical protein